MTDQVVGEVINLLVNSRRGYLDERLPGYEFRHYRDTGSTKVVVTLHDPAGKRVWEGWFSDTAWMTNLGIQRALATMCKAVDAEYERLLDTADFELGPAGVWCNGST